MTPHFKLHDALWLQQWGREAGTADGLCTEILANIERTALHMEEVRTILGRPMLVQSWFRPRIYNAAIGGAKNSAHCEGLALDFRCTNTGDIGADCDGVRAKLLPYLDALGLRLEDNGPGARWVHLDLRPVPTGGRRFFKP